MTHLQHSMLKALELHDAQSIERLAERVRLRRRGARRVLGDLARAGLAEEQSGEWSLTSQGDKARDKLIHPKEKYRVSHCGECPFAWYCCESIGDEPAGCVLCDGVTPTIDVSMRELPALCPLVVGPIIVEAK